MDIRPDSKFSTGYGYPKSVFLREPDPDKDIRFDMLIRYFENAGSIGCEMNFDHLCLALGADPMDHFLNSKFS